MMHDDEPLLKGVARAARRSGLFDEEPGESQGSDKAALRAPLGDEFVRSTVNRLADLMAKEERAKVAPLRPRGASRLAWIGGAAALATAAAAAVWLVTAMPLSGNPRLPIYEMELLAGGTAATRGTNATPQSTLTPGARLELVVRPQTAVEGPLEAKAFALLEGNVAVELEVAPQIAPGGAARLQGVVGQTLLLPAGTHSVWIALGRPGTLPTASSLPALVQDQATRDDLVLLSQPVRLQP